MPKGMSRRITIRLDDKDLNAIQAIADMYGISASDVIRMCIKTVNALYSDRLTLGKALRPIMEIIAEIEKKS